NAHFQMKDHPHLYVAGQLSGVEGYVESAASGLLSSLAMISNLKGEEFNFPASTMMASLGHYVHAANPANFQPMNANFGILNTTIKDKNQRVQQALEAVDAYVST
ncbi:MAG TPA: FADH(2)-oxidizing methylenetetrahydrofolate--tRNA-(uracil(54)-C(5))-methyltransferase TrmFO, partial [Erysipelothrix sp.]|nr:FADH(2)-oxidizing methylenetetrahydrofolate--tRNA-(uracil(54)-C(5))-methyltransferase TrmFO [Erysipelothrix sp.]